MRKIVLIAFAIQLSLIAFSQSDKEILSKILSEIKLIKRASYLVKSSSSAPYDTLIVNTYERLMNEYINPEDTFIGAGFSYAFVEDSLKYDYCYDGDYGMRFDWESNSVKIDTLTGDDMHRPMAPFFIYTKLILEYIISDADSVKVSIKDLQDNLKVDIFIKGKIVEFVGGKPRIRYGSELASKYILWINKSTYLPFKAERNMPHQKTIRYVSNLKYSYEYPEKFVAASLIPAEFSINNKKDNPIPAFELKDKIAPDWKLMDINGDSIALKELKSKIILIQLTGIGCGPCHASVPFLKTLIADYKTKDFELLRIETTNANIKALKSYHSKNELNCKYLISNKKLYTDYKIKGVPVFLILDEKRVIKNVIIGFRKGLTEKLVVDSLNKLL